MEMQLNRMRQLLMEMERGGASFKQSYRCSSASVLAKNQAAQIETGDKIIMPPSALGVLSSMRIDYPMLFELRNLNNPGAAAGSQRVSHCGVWEFTATEGLIYMPNWMMKNLHLKEGDLVEVKNVSLPKGKYIKLQPHTKDFLDITNPRAVLEKTLRSFTCLTTGDTIKLPYNGKEYYVDIIETKPSNAVSIVETDCEVDFAPPLDYKEPEKPVAAASLPTNKAALTAPDQVEEPKFSPFSGRGRRLDGKPSAAPVSSSSFVAVANNAQPSSSSSQGTSRRAQGKLVFGSNVGNHTTTTPKETHKEASKEQAKTEKKEEPKFQPFTGKKYVLI